MQIYKRMSRIRRYAAVSLLGTTCAFGSCDLGSFESTSTVTLDGREVVQFLVRSWIVTPITDLIDAGIDRVFDQLDDDDE